MKAKLNTTTKSGSLSSSALVRPLIAMVRKATKWAWKSELDTLAAIERAQANPPQGMVKMYCAGWRDKNAIGWGEYCLRSIHATPGDALAAIESLRAEHQWDASRKTSCGQEVSVYWPNIQTEGP
jgi:hypothetical protein